MYIWKTDEGKNYIEKVEEVNQLITDNPAAIYILEEQKIMRKDI